ncbi:MAG: hypoxanthine phosphoribosyltransferase [bacterium]
MNTAPQPGLPLFTPEMIRTRVDTLADEIARDYHDRAFTVVTILKGGFVFAADLVRALSQRGIHPLVDFIAFSSYGSGTTSRRHVTLKQEPSLPVRNQPILLVDDILDTGHTLQAAQHLLASHGATEVRLCVLLDKPSRREVPVTAHYTGFQIENVFVVGYGLDYDNRYRELPYLTVLTPGEPT